MPAGHRERPQRGVVRGGVQFLRAGGERARDDAAHVLRMVPAHRADARDDVHQPLRVDERRLDVEAPAQHDGLRRAGERGIALGAAGAGESRAQRPIQPVERVAQAHAQHLAVRDDGDHLGGEDWLPGGREALVGGLRRPGVVEREEFVQEAGGAALRQEVERAVGVLDGRVSEGGLEPPEEQARAVRSVRGDAAVEVAAVEQAVVGRGVGGRAARAGAKRAPGPREDELALRAVGVGRVRQAARELHAGAAAARFASPAMRARSRFTWSRSSTSWR